MHVKATYLSPAGDLKCTGQGRRINPSSPERMLHFYLLPLSWNKCLLLPQSTLRIDWQCMQNTQPKDQGVQHMPHIIYIYINNFTGFSIPIYKCILFNKHRGSKESYVKSRSNTCHQAMLPQEPAFATPF